MAQCRLVLLFASLWWIAVVVNASAGDADPIYKTSITDQPQEVLLKTDTSWRNHSRCGSFGALGPISASSVDRKCTRSFCDGLSAKISNSRNWCPLHSGTKLALNLCPIPIAAALCKACVEQCEMTGCVGEKCFQHCKFSSDGVPIDGPWFLQEPLYQRWKQWDCHTECRYHCMLDREEEREKLGYKPVKYHGKWPFKRVYGIQEPVSVALSALNLAMQFHGWVSFFILVNYKLPLRPNRRTYYEYTGLLHLYGLLAMNSWLWSAVFHSRDVELTEKLDCSSAVALLGFSLILAIMRAFNVRDEAARVMIAAPLIAFVTTHILYLNFYQLDYGLNMKVCLGMGLAQLLIWAVWAGVTRHPARWKLWVVAVGGGLAMLLDIYDFPPYWKFVDAHALWHATAIPLTFLWWSFIRDDAEFRTTTLVKKAK